MASPSVIVGRTLGHYRVVEEIGSGGMGVVYRARDQRLERDVALKVLPAGTLADESARKRFRREAVALSKTNHPNIATVHDFDTQDGMDFLVMEYIPGTTIDEKLAVRSLREKEVIALGTQLAEGLAAAHEQGVVHRDLKPANLRLASDGRLKILDFGLAKLQEPLRATATTASLTATRAVVGTLPYMAPEQLLGDEVDPRTDIYTAGVVLYEMATGRRPFADLEGPQLMGAILRQVPLPARQLNPELSAELERIIGKCLEKGPEDRFQSAKELAVDLRRMGIASSTTQASGPTAIRKSRTIKTAAAAVALAAIVAVSVFLFQSRHAHALAATDSIVLADFVNSTSDPVFDDALNQALTVQLEQSPFLKILPRSNIQSTLRLMGHSPDESLKPDLGREVCQRAGGKAVLWGTIAPLGTQYVIGLRAAECISGADLASDQIQVANKEAVLKALDKAATHLRSKLGESLASVQKFDTPLEQATTPSLEALKAYSLGRKTQYHDGNPAALPLYKRAIELDPDFAVAYAALGITYSNLGESRLANENLQRAYELRERVSEREKLRIAAFYNSYVLWDLVKGSEMYGLWAQAYPRDGVPPGNLGVINLYLGQYDKALTETLNHLRLDPDDVTGYANLMVAYADLNRLNEAKAAYQQARGRMLDDLGLHGNLYEIAFLEGDAAEMERQMAWAAGKAGEEDTLLSFASDTEAFYGRLSKARTLSLRAIDSARRSDQKETAAGWQLNGALREAEFGNAAQARKATLSALALASTRDAHILAALSLARTGAVAEAQQMAEGLAKRYLHDTLINGYWLPTIRAAIEINRGNPGKAIDILQAAASYELGEPSPWFGGGGSLYPIYLRGQSYLVLHRGNEAAEEFQKILDHRSIVKNCPFGALARLGLARAYALQRQTAKSRSSYEEFLNLWKDADADTPILRQAKAEYAQLQ